ncbi:MAG: hypothetical protein CVT96_07570 [Bacteroidetes bacterium HGW-Bacteroidetes-13]|nr:MAG: hypothetical protein CVT96_07570 [Bacteroidetes bacterium HGW-Bacteroidetes-13]
MINMQKQHRKFYFSGLEFLFTLFFIVVFGLGLSAQEKILIGKVTIENTGASEVTVLNTTKKTATITDEDGMFAINAEAGDNLQISSVQTGEYNQEVKEADFTAELFEIKLKIAVNMLKEVEVTEYKSINAASVGIIPADFVSYTPAEKDLMLAKGNRGLSIDGILNMLSGRTKKMKRNLAVERDQMALAQIQSLYSDEYYIQKLKIQEVQIPAFQYFLLDNADFVKAMKAKNVKLTSFLSLDLADKFLKLQNESDKD